MASKDKPVRVASIRIENILGIQQVEIKPGVVTAIEGQNGQGKTSILDAIKAAVGGGHDATLLRKGAETGEIVLTLSDGVRIQTTVTTDGTKKRIDHPEFGKLSKPADFTKRLLDAFALNPVEFLTAPSDKRLSILLSSIPMTVNPAEIKDAVALCENVSIDTSKHALQVLDAIGKTLFEQRTGINRSVKDKRAAVAEMRKALPQDTGEDCQERLRAARGAYNVANRDYLEGREAVIRCFEDGKASDFSVATAAIEAKEAEWRRRVEEVNAEFRAVLDEMKANRARVSANHDQARADALEKLESDSRAKLADLTGAVADAEAAAEAYTRASGARDSIFEMENRASRLQEKADAHTEALDSLDAVKSRLLEKMPVAGLEVRGAEIFIDGVPFDRVNESKRVRLAIEIAMLRAGNLPLICIDGAERLDSAHLEALETIAAETGVQLFLAKVTDGPLQVFADGVAA